MFIYLLTESVVYNNFDGFRGFRGNMEWSLTLQAPPRVGVKTPTGVSGWYFGAFHLNSEDRHFY